MCEQIKNKIGEVQKGLENDVANKMKSINKDLDKRTHMVNKIEEIISQLSSEIKKSPTNDRTMQRSIQILEEAIRENSRFLQEEAASNNCNMAAVAQDYPSSFASIIEPEIGIEIVEKRQAKNTGRNTGLPSNPSQMTEKDLLVRYKDTFSTCDNRTISNNLEVTNQANPNEQEMLNGKELNLYC